MTSPTSAAGGPAATQTAAQARIVADELAADVILAVHRLAKQSTLYEDDNEARTRQLDATMQAVKAYGTSTGRNISLFWMQQSVFVGRRLLRGNRGIYAAALELADLLKPLGVSQMVIGYDVPVEELRQLQEVFRALQRKMKPTMEQLSFTRIRLRRAPDLDRRFVDERNLPPADRAMRTYAKAVVIMRRFIEQVQRGESHLPIRVRRISQQLTDVAMLAADDLLALAVLHTSHGDDAARAVNAAVLALLMAQQLGVDPRLLSRIAMAALLFDAGKPRVAGIDPTGDVRMGTVMPALAEEQYAQLPGATAAVLTQLAGVNGSAMMQTAAVCEALHVRHAERLGAPYAGLRQPTTTARIIAAAHRFVALAMEHEQERPRTVAEVVTRLQLEARDPAEKNVLSLLMSVLHVYPTGALVELSTGELAQVMDTPVDPARFSRPIVRIVADAERQRLVQPRVLHLALQPDGAAASHIQRVIALPDDAQLQAALESQRSLHGPAPPPTGEEEPETVFRRPSATPGAAAASAPPPGAGGSSPPPSASSPPASHGARAPASVQRAAEGAASRGVSSAPPASSPPALHGPPRRSLPPPDHPVDEAGQALTPRAQGRLEQTPLLHVLIYLADRQFTGSLVLEAPDGDRFVLYVREGTFSKIYSARQVAPLDRVLLEMQAVDEDALLKSLVHVSKTKQLHGEYLLAEGLITPHQLEEALELQIVRKAGAMFGLPADSSFAFYDGVNLLDQYGGAGLIPCDPLRVVMAGVRQSAGDEQVDLTVAKLSDHLLSIHPDADIKRLRLTDYEQEVVDLMRARPMRYADLLAAEVVQERTLKLTIYALMVTRSLDLGTSAKPPLSVRPRSRSRPPSQPPSSGDGARAASGLAASERAAGLFDRIARSRRSSRPPGRYHISSVPPADADPHATDTSQSVPSKPPAGRRVEAERPPSAPAPSTPPAALHGAGAQPPSTDEQRRAKRTSSGPPPRSAGKPIRVSVAPEPAEGGDTTATATKQPSSSTAAKGRRPAAPVPKAASAKAASADVTAARTTSSRNRLSRDEVTARLAKLDAQSFFDLLGLEQRAAQDEVQQAYLQLARRWHPDRLPSELGDLKPSVSKIFARMNEAFRTLSNPDERRSYVERLAAGGGTPDDEAQVSRLVEAAMDVQKAEVLLKKGDLSGAEKLARGAHEADPDQPEYATLLAWIEAQRLGPPPAGKAAGHYARQRAVLNGVLAAEPKYEQALFYRACLLKQEGAMEAAMKDFKKVVRLNPRNLDAARELRVFEMRQSKEGKGKPKKGWGGLLGGKS